MVCSSFPFVSSRRDFLKTAATLAAGSVNLPPLAVADAVVADSNSRKTGTDLVADIQHSIVWNGRKGGTSWFHPRPCLIPNPQDTRRLIVFMTMQDITGSDVFGQVHWTVSSDRGRTWTEPAPIAALARRDIDGGLQEGVCDVVPQFHPPSGTVLAMGHNVYYKAGKLAKPAEDRWPVYAVRDRGGQWSGPRKLAWDDPRGTGIYTCGCGERLLLPKGDILVPISYGPKDRKDRAATAFVCAFDGRQLAVKQVGNELRNTAGRGLLEPSLAHFAGRYFMTLRAEDDRGHVTVSPDGLRWAEPKPWSWDDGEPLTMSTTQQHWLTHSERLHLVYTRKTEENAKVMRWRAPLYLAAVDPQKLCLIRSTERVVLPLLGDAANNPRHVALMGNFHTLAASPDESWVTVGENRFADGWKGDVLLARIRWSTPNRLFAPPK